MDFVEIAVGVLQLSNRTLHERENVLYRLHVQHQRVLRHPLAVELHTVGFYSIETEAGRRDSSLIVACVGGSDRVLGCLLHLHDEVGLAQNHEVVG